MRPTPPHSLQAEQLVLRGVLIYGAKALAPIKSWLDEKDFFETGHAAIYAAAVDLERQGQEPNPLSVFRWMQSRGTLPTLTRLSSGHVQDFLVDQAGRGVDFRSIESFARVVHGQAIARRKQQWVGELSKHSQEEQTRVD